jgi:hypothetical protein
MSKGVNLLMASKHGSLDSQRTFLRQF